jgi:hypothetical protein
MKPVGRAALAMAASVAKKGATGAPAKKAKF